MSTKNIVITGANSGIGLQTARGLYRDGHHIIFGSRNQQRNIAAIQDITKSQPNSKGTIKSLKLDLSKRASVQQFVENVKKQFDYIDILLNNAGLVMNNRQLNQSGIEMTMAINHFGHFLLTYLLFPLVKKSKQARIINLSSAMHTSCRQSTVSDLGAERFSSFAIYQKSKLANVQFTTGLAERLTKYPNIKTMCLHPGIVDSQFGSGLSILGCFKCLCCCIYVNNETGARTSLFLSRSNFNELRSGEYYDSNTQLGQMNPLGRNRDHVEALWRQSEKIYNIKFEI